MLSQVYNLKVNLYFTQLEVLKLNLKGREVNMGHCKDENNFV